MSRDYSVAETRDNLTRLLRIVEAGDHVHITRRGRPVAVVISAAEYDELTARPAGFSEALRRFSTSSLAADAVMDAGFFEGLRDRGTGRER